MASNRAERAICRHPDKENPLASYSPITCISCGREDLVNSRYASAQKYCGLCQILRDYELGQATGRGNRPKKCMICEQEFWPIKASWVQCGDCSTISYSENSKIDCWIKHACEGRGVAAPGTEHSCMTCVQSTAAHRHAYIKRLYELRPERLDYLEKILEKKSQKA